MRESDSHGQCLCFLGSARSTFVVFVRRGDREASCQAEVSFLCGIQEDGVFWGNFNCNNDAQRLALCLEKRKELIIASFKPLRQGSWFQTV